MVRSFGSYWRTRRNPRVQTKTSAGRMGPPMRRLEPLPAVSIFLRFDAASSRAKARSSAEDGVTRCMNCLFSELTLTLRHRPKRRQNYAMNFEYSAEQV